MDLAIASERRHEDAGLRTTDLAQLAQIAAGSPTREHFLTELTLDPPDAASGEARAPLLDEDYLILSTVHSGKGQEWTSMAASRQIYQPDQRWRSKRSGGYCMWR